jgi:hypothetical protein
MHTSMYTIKLSKITYIIKSWVCGNTITYVLYTHTSAHKQAHRHACISLYTVHTFSKRVQIERTEDDIWRGLFCSNTPRPGHWVVRPRGVSADCLCPWVVPKQAGTGGSMEASVNSHQFQVRVIRVLEHSIQMSSAVHNIFNRGIKTALVTFQ